LWSIRFRSGDQIFCAIEISPPDLIVILSPENRGKMNDRRNSLYGLLQRIRFEKIAFHASGSSGNFLAGPYKRTAVYARIDEPSQKPRAHESCSTSELLVVRGAFHGFDVVVPDAEVSKQFSASWKSALRKAFATGKADTEKPKASRQSSGQ